MPGRADGIPGRKVEEEAGMKRHGRNRPIALVAVVVAACAVIGIGLSVVFWNTGIAEIKEVPMSFAVENLAAFNVDTDQVHFGSAPPGSSASRKIRVQSNEERMVTAVVVGNISSVVSISENDFIVGPGNSKLLELTASAPEDAKVVTVYTGTLRLIFRKV